MAGSVQWQGSATFAGMPIPMAFFGAVATEDSPFRMLDPEHKQPVKQMWQSVDGTVMERDRTVRGVEYGDGYVEVDLDLTLSRTELLELHFHPAASVEFEYAKGIYYVGPSKAPGSKAAINGLWNLLHSKKLVASLDGWVQKSNARPWTVLLRATDDALMAYAMLYASQVRENDVFSPIKDAKAAKNMAVVMDMHHTVAPFEWASVQDTYSQRRDAAIEAAIAGQPLPEAREAPEVPVVADLISKVEAMAAEAAKPKAKPRRKAAA